MANATFDGVEGIVGCATAKVCLDAAYEYLEWCVEIDNCQDNPNYHFALIIYDTMSNYLEKKLENQGEVQNE